VKIEKQHNIETKPKYNSFNYLLGWVLQYFSKYG